jgi:hypothetical protein
MTTRELHQRLSAIERDIASLKKQKLGKTKAHPVHALEALHGSFEDDEAFREAMRLGRKWRESTAPPSNKAKRK